MHWSRAEREREAFRATLAAVGLYGVTAHGVQQRTAEIDVRMALGANRESVIALVLRRAFGPVGLGLLLGIAAAMGAGQVIASLLYGVKPWNPALLGVAIILLGFAACVAAYLPARRAASVDLMQAVRNE